MFSLTIVLAVIALVIVLAVALHFLLIAGPEMNRRNAAAAGIHLGGRHAQQPRLVRAH